MRIREEFRSTHSRSQFNPDAFGDWQEAVDSALRAVRILDPNAIVAGGACRDAILGNDIADIDIYMHLSEAFNIAAIGERLSFLGFRDVNQMVYRGAGEEDQGAYSGMEHLRCVFDCTMMDKPVQVIVMDCPTYSNTVDAFGVNISKCWYAGAHIVAQLDALHDMEHSTITVPRGVTVSARYVNKVLAKLEPDMLVNNGTILCQGSPLIMPSGVRLGGIGLVTSVSHSGTELETAEISFDTDPTLNLDWYINPFTEGGGVHARPVRTTRVTEDSTDLDINRLLQEGN